MPKSGMAQDGTLVVGHVSRETVAAPSVNGWRETFSRFGFDKPVLSA